MAKKEITISEFREIIKEEALKLKKRMVLENEKRALMSELKSINESYMDEYEEFEGDEMEEGRIGDFLGTSKKAKRDKLEKDYRVRAKVWAAKGVIKGMSEEELEELLKQAEADKYEGAPGYDRKTGVMTYRPSNTINWKGLGLNRSGSFDGGQ